MQLDEAQNVRVGEEINYQNLEQYLQTALNVSDKLVVKQFPSGYSNLTYLLTIGTQELVLRRPPKGSETINKGHDMGREYKVLAHLHPHFSLSPRPLLYCEDLQVINTPFYIMQRVEGVIIRAQKTVNMSFQEAQTWYNNMTQTLATLHQIPIHTTGLATLGKAEGYLARQIEGWRNRWAKVQTEIMPPMDFVSEWLQANIVDSPPATFIHNDFKYDNLVLNPNNISEIRAVLDWEMATVGDPLSDLGIALSYVTEALDPPPLLAFNLKPQAGSLTRREIVAKYQELTNKNMDNILYYFVFGTFKLGVIVQQIYYRYKQGYTQDKRFEPLIHLARACGEMAQKAIKTEEIGQK